MLIDAPNSSQILGGTSPIASDAAQFAAELAKARADNNVTVLSVEPSNVLGTNQQGSTDLIRRTAGTMMELENTYHRASSEFFRTVGAELGLTVPSGSLSPAAAGQATNTQTAQQLQAGPAEAAPFASSGRSASTGLSGAIAKLEKLAQDKMLGLVSRRPSLTGDAARESRKNAEELAEATAIDSQLTRLRMAELQQQGKRTVEIQFMSANLQELMTVKNIYMDWGKNIVTKVGEAVSKLTQGS